MGPMISAASPLLPDGIILRFKGRKRTTPIFLEAVLMGGDLKNAQKKITPICIAVILLNVFAFPGAEFFFLHIFIRTRFRNRF